MNYDLFKEIVINKFMNFMPLEFREYQLDIHPVAKVNQTMDALNLIPTGNNTWKVTPTMYVNHMYDHYRKCGDTQEVLRCAAESMAQAFTKAQCIRQEVDFTTAKDNIIMVLVNTEQNKEMLVNIPSRRFQDLSIIYRWVMDKRGDGISSTIVSNGLVEKLAMNEEQLYKAAVENTVRLFPPTVKSMDDVIRDMLIADGMSSEATNAMTGEEPQENMMYVISNDIGINGAASMIYENELHKLAEMLETDLYIMPSSIHEVIAVSIKIGNPDELARMVNEINIDQVSLDERLSNQVYHYDKDLRKLSMATDTAYKTLGVTEND